MSTPLSTSRAPPPSGCTAWASISHVCVAAFQTRTLTTLQPPASYILVADERRLKGALRRGPAEFRCALLADGALFVKMWRTKRIFINPSWGRAAAPSNLGHCVTPLCCPLVQRAACLASPNRSPTAPQPLPNPSLYGSLYGPSTAPLWSLTGPAQSYTSQASCVSAAPSRVLRSSWDSISS